MLQVDGLVLFPGSFAPFVQRDSSWNDLDAMNARHARSKRQRRASKHSAWRIKPQHGRSRRFLGANRF
ncbi:MAG TPA: hypothetical protein VEO54_10205 [Thermoanaerobaculia bacterium]|nr:hypothetical protein [Thermoanaerobaculia bacterium]